MLGLGASAACGFGHLLGVWERVPADQGRRVCIYDTRTRSPRDISGFEMAALSAPPSQVNGFVCESLCFLLLRGEGLR